MHGAVVARGAVIEFRGIPAHISNEILVSLPGGLGPHHQHSGVCGNPRNGLELIEFIAWRFAENPVGLRNHRNRGEGHQNGVAIRPCLGDMRKSDSATCASAILNHNALLQDAAHRLRHRPAHRVCHSARRKGHHHRDGPRGKRLLRRDNCKPEHAKGCSTK